MWLTQPWRNKTECDEGPKQRDKTARKLCVVHTTVDPSGEERRQTERREEPDRKERKEPIFLSLECLLYV
jgi:hypothetical protein